VLHILSTGAMRRSELKDGREVVTPMPFLFPDNNPLLGPKLALIPTPEEMEHIHIGNLIRKEVERQGITVVAFAHMIGYSRANIYKLYDHSSIDTALLLRISILLKHDFFQNYSRTL